MERISDEELDTLICKVSKIYEAAESLNFVNRQSKNLLALQELKKLRAADKQLDIKGQLLLIRDKCPDIYTRICNGPDCVSSFGFKVRTECNYPVGDCVECWNKALEGDDRNE